VAKKAVGALGAKTIVWGYNNHTRRPPRGPRRLAEREEVDCGTLEDTPGARRGSTGPQNRARAPSTRCLAGRGNQEKPLVSGPNLGSDLGGRRPFAQLVGRTRCGTWRGVLTKKHPRRGQVAPGHVARDHVAGILRAVCFFRSWGTRRTRASSSGQFQGGPGFQAGTCGVAGITRFQPQAAAHPHYGRFPVLARRPNQQGGRSPRFTGPAGWGGTGCQPLATGAARRRATARFFKVRVRCEAADSRRLVSSGGHRVEHFRSHDHGAERWRPPRMARLPFPGCVRSRRLEGGLAGRGFLSQGCSGGVA